MLSPDRKALVSQLEATGDPVAVACSAAIEEGAQVEDRVWEPWSRPASELATTYQRRRDLARRHHVDVESRGVEAAIWGFRAAGETRVGFIRVLGATREYSLFLSKEDGTFVACFSHRA